MIILPVKAGFYSTSPTLKEWLEDEIKRASEETLAIMEGCKNETPTHAPKLSPKDLEKFLQELREIGFVLDQIQKNYQEYPSSKSTLKNLHERRELLRQEILDIDHIESVFASLSFHSHILLSQKDETQLRESIADILKTYPLSGASTTEDLQHWSEIIPLLSEIKFAEKTIQLISRLSLSYESRIQSISESFQHGKKNAELSVQNLSDNLNELRKALEKDDPSKLKNWHSVPEFLKKTLQVKIAPELMEILDQLESKFRSLYGSLPDEKEFESPLLKLGEFQEEQKRNLIALKEKWQKTSRVPVLKEGSDVFLYALKHFELVWYKQILDQNQILRKQYNKKLELLHSLMDAYSAKYTRNPSMKDAHSLSHAQDLIRKKPIKIRKLKSLEERFIKLRMNFEIRIELTRKKEDALLRWKTAFESRSLVPLEFSTPESERVFYLGKELSSLLNFRDSYSEILSLFASKQSTPPLNVWNFWRGWIEKTPSDSKKLIQIEADFGRFDIKNFRMD